MRFLVSSDDAKLQYVQAERGCNASDKSAPLPQVTTILTTSPETTIQCMASLTYPSTSRGDVEAVAIACKEGSVKILDAENGEVLATIEASSTSQEPEDESKTVDAGFVSIQCDHGYIATCNNAGLARFTKLSSIWSNAQKTYETILPAPISVMRMHPEEVGVIAFAGKENELSIWKSDTDGEQDPFTNLKPFWTARNVKNDKLDLRVPVWISDLRFFDPSSDQGYGLVTSTRYRQLRLYETSKARRPLTSLDVAEHPITQLEFDDTKSRDAGVTVMFTDTQGNIMHADVSKGTIIGSYKGFSGAVASIVTSPDNKILAAGGMDSYLRVYSLAGHEQIASVYLGSRISSVLVLEDELVVKEEDDDLENADQDEDVWDGLEEIEEPKTKKLRSR